MRVLVTLLALVTAPFLASVSQEPAGSPSRTGNDAVRHSEAGDVEDQANDAGDGHCWTGEHDAARETHSRGHGHHWAKGHAKHACAPPVGDGGGGAGGGGGGGGTVAFATIGGMLFNDANANAGIVFGMDGADSPLPGWTVDLNVVNLDGTVTFNARTVTDASGNYAFPGLLAGKYLGCEVVQSGWRLTFPGTQRPACAAGFGYTVA